MKLKLVFAVPLFYFTVGSKILLHSNKKDETQKYYYYHSHFHFACSKLSLAKNLHFSSSFPSRSEKNFQSNFFTAGYGISLKFKRSIAAIKFVAVVFYMPLNPC